MLLRDATTRCYSWCVMLYRNKDGTKVVSEEDDEISFLHYVYAEVQDEIELFTCRDYLYTEHSTTKVAAYTVMERRNNGMAIAVTTKNMFISSLYDKITLISFCYRSSNLLHVMCSRILMSIGK